MRPARAVGGGGRQHLCFPVAVAPLTVLPHQCVGTNFSFSFFWLVTLSPRARGCRRARLPWPAGPAAGRDPAWPPDVRPTARRVGGPTAGAAARAGRARDAARRGHRRPTSHPMGAHRAVTRGETSKAPCCLPTVGVERVAAARAAGARGGPPAPTRGARRPPPETAGPRARRVLRRRVPPARRPAAAAAAPARRARGTAPTRARRVRGVPDRVARRGGAGGGWGSHPRPRRGGRGRPLDTPALGRGMTAPAGGSGSAPPPPSPAFRPPATPPADGATGAAGGGGGGCRRGRSAGGSCREASAPRWWAAAAAAAAGGTATLGAGGRPSAASRQQSTASSSNGLSATCRAERSMRRGSNYSQMTVMEPASCD